MSGQGIAYTRLDEDKKGELLSLQSWRLKKTKYKIKDKKAKSKTHIKDVKMEKEKKV